ncbi:MAG: low specificity L-threonine aldolase [Clostridiales bacterium]|nr:low specificity L-threonine aldolase [Clostridiales bacterium]
MEGAHPAILEALVETNLLRSPGYGLDPYSDSAKEKIRLAADAADAEVFFLVGGTQTNALVIKSLLRSYEGVIAPETGHISVHEAGAIEMGGHKVLAVPHKLGKIAAEDIKKVLTAFRLDGNRDHMVKPGMVYISQPTEYGTLYSLEELTAISNLCREADIPLYVDGARMAYGLASPSNDVTLPDLARLADAFYIGGTKCGALFGEALVMRGRAKVPGFFSIIKQNGALLAKGRLLGLQFDTLFTDGLYFDVGRSAIAHAQKLQSALQDAGFRLFFESPTNQIFVILENRTLDALSEEVEMGFWETYDANHTVMRFATSWATTEEDIARLIALLPRFAPKKQL